MEKVKISTDFIKLGSLLKLINIVQSGGEAKYYLIDNFVIVNKEKENRRGRKIYPNDILKINKIEYVIEND